MTITTPSGTKRGFEIRKRSTNLRTELNSLLVSRGNESRQSEENMISSAASGVIANSAVSIQVNGKLQGI